MSWFSTLFRENRKPKDHEASSAFTIRQGKSMPVDDAFRAWTCGDLELMLKATSTKTNPIDRHFLLQSIVSEAYKRREKERYRQLCIEYAEKHIKEFPSLAGFLKEHMGGELPWVTTFQLYATLLTEAGEFEKALTICEEAIRYGLHDNTSSSFKGRIDRIKKKALEKNASQAVKRTATRRFDTK